MQRAGAAVSEALRAHRKPIITALTKQAQQAADRITAARQLGNVTIEQLVLQGKHDAASTLAAAGANSQVLHRLTEWAHRHLGDYLDVSDPDAVPAS